MKDKLNESLKCHDQDYKRGPNNRIVLIAVSRNRGANCKVFLEVYLAILVSYKVAGGGC